MQSFIYSLIFTHLKDEESEDRINKNLAPGHSFRAYIFSVSSEVLMAIVLSGRGENVDVPKDWVRMSCLVPCT